MVAADGHQAVGQLHDKARRSQADDIRRAAAHRPPVRPFRSSRTFSSDFPVQERQAQTPPDRHLGQHRRDGRSLDAQMPSTEHQHRVQQTGWCHGPHWPPTACQPWQ